METFLYNVSEKKRERSVSIDEVMSYYSNIDIDVNNSQSEEIEGEGEGEEIDYYIDLDEESLRKEYKTYRVSELRDILKYYSIPRKNMRKIEIIRKIVAFELDQQNAALVQLRYSDS